MLPRRVYIKSIPDDYEIVMPITPFVEFDGKSEDSTVNIKGFGEVFTGIVNKLATWSINSFFPNKNYTYIIGSKQDPSYYINLIEKWRTNGHVIRFRYSTDEHDIHTYYCKILRFKHGEKDGTGDNFYTIEFKEYKFIEIEGSAVFEAEQQYSYKSSTYTVKKGDTILTIAQKVYGDSNKWTSIMSNNNLSNPLDIEEGTELIV